jgi:putative flippase GtrA
MNTTNSVATSGASNAVSLSVAIILMYVLNAAWGHTFPPEVSAAFVSVVAWIFHVVCAKTKLCDIDGDGKSDVK